MNRVAADARPPNGDGEPKTRRVQNRLTTAPDNNSERGFAQALAYGNADDFRKIAAAMDALTQQRKRTRSLGRAVLRQHWRRFRAMFPSEAQRTVIIGKLIAQQRRAELPAIIFAMAMSEHAPYSMLDGHEQVLLAAMMNGRNDLPIGEHDFTSPPNLLIYNIARSLKIRAWDALQDELQREGRLAEVGGIPRLTAIQCLPTDKANVDYALDCVLGASQERRARDVAKKLQAGEITQAEAAAELTQHPGAVSRDDFYAYMPMHSYIFIPARDLWPASSVDARVPAITIGKKTIKAGGKTTEVDNKIKASQWLDQCRPVETMTWAPGLPMLIRDRLMAAGGWIDRRGCSTFNLYRAPNIKPGNSNKAARWLDHVKRLYADEADHILNWLAHRVQRPQEKINHALVLIGAQGIGKDTLLYPVKCAVGLWNVAEILPPALLGRFNGFVKSVMLCVNEVHDLGELDRYAFYERLKAYTAAPPDVIRVDEKHIREYSVLNVCGVVLTSNYKTSGLYLPADDRRHFVAWSDANKADFSEDYWRNLYAWYGLGGIRHVAAYLAQLNLGGFNAKAPPPKTDAFYEIVESNRAPENAELADALEQLGWPDVVTKQTVIDAIPDTDEFRYWLRDRKNARLVPHRFEEVGYVAVRSPDERAGRWKIAGKSVVIYAKQTLCKRDQIIAARKLNAEGRT
jgi:hypothetical protein